jgi:hypothetical protein
VATNSSSKPEQVFPPGFERDTKALLMLREYGVISRAEVRRNVERLGVDLVPEPDLVAPALKPPVTPAPGNIDLVWDDEADDSVDNEDNEE